MNKEQIAKLLKNIGDLYIELSEEMLPLLQETEVKPPLKKKAVKKKAAAKKAKEEEVEEEEEIEEAEVDEEITDGDLRKGLKAYAKAHGKEKAFELLDTFNGAKKVADVSKKDYAKLLKKLS